MNHPTIVALAGPNGAWKSTVGPTLIRDMLGVTEFVNADDIARGISAFDSGKVALAAGRIMLDRMKELANKRVSFSFETTLASRSFAPWIESLIPTGYEFHLYYFWLPNSEMAVRRVRERVRAGGHGIPEEVIRRRFEASLVNLLELYIPLAATWFVYDNTGSKLRLVATGSKRDYDAILDEEAWNEIEKRFRAP